MQFTLNIDPEDLHENRSLIEVVNDRIACGECHRLITVIYSGQTTAAQLIMKLALHVHGRDTH